MDEWRVVGVLVKGVLYTGLTTGLVYFIYWCFTGEVLY